MGIYIHIPFCKRKCSYCNFYSIYVNEVIILSYFKALWREISALPKTDCIFDSIFIGGGTPSFVSSILITDTIKNIYNKFNISDSAEITIEMNPDSFNKEKLDIYRGGGINRFSIGVQSFFDEELMQIGRIHNVKDVLSALKVLKEEEVNYSIDLMFGLPYQTLEKWTENLKRAISFEPYHISSYLLSLERGTELALRKNELELPDENLQQQMYFFMIEFLGKHGYEQYEISNFAKSGKESIHNMKYWQRKTYIGFGASAHSFQNETRWNNVYSIQKYIDCINEKGNARENVSNINLKTKIDETIFLSLRTKTGLNLNQLNDICEKNILQFIYPFIKSLIDEDLLILNKDIIYFTKKGFFLSDQIIGEISMKIDNNK